MSSALWGVAILLAVLGAVFSCFLVVKGWTLFSDGLSHVVFPGVVVANICGLPLIVGGFFGAGMCIVIFSVFDRHPRLKDDAILGMIFISLFALGLLLRDYFALDAGVQDLLFGSIESVQWADFYLLLTVLSISIGALLIYYPTLKLWAIDEHYSQTLAISSALIRLIFLLLMALVTVIAMKGVGVVLTLGLFTLPAASTFLWVRHFHSLILLAVFLALLGVVAGYGISLYFSSAFGVSIVLSLSLIFVFSLSVNNCNARRKSGEKAKGIC